MHQQALKLTALSSRCVGLAHLGHELCLSLQQENKSSKSLCEGSAGPGLYVGLLRAKLDFMRSRYQYAWHGKF